MKGNAEMGTQKQNSLKIIRKILVVLPILILLIAIISKWLVPYSHIVLLIILALVCYCAAIILFLISKFKYKSQVHSLGATFISLMSMKEVAGISLIIVSILSFSFLVNYIQKLADKESIHWESLSGAIFSFGLLFFVVTIFNFIEEQRLARTKVPETERPAITPGLVLTLSKLIPGEELQKFIKNIDKLDISKREFVTIFKKVEKFKSTKNLNDIKSLFVNYKNKTDYEQFFNFIVESRLFPMLKAINYHREKLSTIWVLVTKETEDTSWKIFEKIFKKFYNRDNDIDLISEKIKNPDDIDEISKSIDRIYLSAVKDSNLDEQEITSDITGGPSSVSVGIILACVRSKRRVQFLSQNNFQLQQIDVNVHSIPHLFEEMVEQVDLIRKNEIK